MYHQCQAEVLNNCEEGNGDVNDDRDGDGSGKKKPLDLEIASI